MKAPSNKPNNLSLFNIFAAQERLAMNRGVLYAFLTNTLLGAIIGKNPKKFDKKFDEKIEF